jgi:hypothetical protein
MREWNFAVAHAQRLPIPEKFTTKLRDLQDCDLRDATQRLVAIQGLVEVGADMGVFVSSADQEFDDFAAPWTRGDPRRPT